MGFADADRRVELRRFSEVAPEYIADHWISCQLPFCVVNTPEEYVRWYLTGGNALITIEMTKRFLPNFMKASPCVKIGSLGFHRCEKPTQGLFTISTNAQNEDARLKKGTNIAVVSAVAVLITIRTLNSTFIIYDRLGRVALHSRTI